jgi:hypothetical protein
MVPNSGLLSMYCIEAVPTYHVGMARQFRKNKGCHGNIELFGKKAFCNHF